VTDYRDYVSARVEYDPPVGSNENAIRVEDGTVAAADHRLSAPEIDGAWP
jgi:hypothetical protein